jgi:hypothetical protein
MTQPHSWRVRRQQGAQLRMHQDKRDGVPICLSVAPCSVPSRHGLETPTREVNQVRRPALTAPARGARSQPQAGTKERPHGTNKRTAPIRSRPRGMRPSDLNTRGTNGQIDISLDERVKAVSRSQIRDFGILNDRFAPMRIKAYRDAHSRRGCERAISATRKSLKSQAAQNVKSPLMQCSCRHLEVV